MTSSSNQATIKQRVEGIVLRAVDTSVESIDQESRVLTVSFSSELPYLRSSWFDDPWIEVLGNKAGEVELQRLNSSAPVLYNHRRDEPGFRIGVVEKAWLDKDRGYAQIKLSQRDEVAGFWQDIQDGILANISVGYQINERTLIKKNKDSPDEYRVTNWTPMEISFVDIPADYTVGVNRNFAVINLNTEVIRMDQETNTPAQQPDAIDTDAITRNAIAEFQTREQERRTNIRSALAPFAERHPEVMQKALDDMSITLEQASAMMLKAAGENLKPVGNTLSHAEVTRDEKVTQRDGMTDMLLNRSMPGQHKLSDNGKRFVGLSLIDLAKRCLGGNLDGVPRHEIVSRALTTSDFPSVLANVANKSLRNAYEIMPRTYQPITNVVSVPDFKTISRTQISGTPSLEEVRENGEYKYGALTDAKEQYAVKTYGKILNFSRQAIINDDLGAFSRILQQFAASAAQLESDLAWAQITGNPTMGDGTALFHADHGNLEGTGAAITVAALGSGRTKLRKQTGLEGMTLNLMPSFLLVPAALETVAQQYVTQTNIIYTKGSDFNPFAGSLQVIAEPRLDASSATAWYLAASPMMVDILEIAYLEGTSGIYTEEQFGFETDGYEIKARLDVGAKVIDWRGLVQNPGA